MAVLTNQTFTIGGSHAVVIRNKMLAGYHGNIENLLITGSDCDNGYICNLGPLGTNTATNATYKEVYETATPATATLATAKVLLIDSVEEDYFIGQTLKDFYNPVGYVARGFYMTPGDVFTVSQDALDGGAAVATGSYVVAQNGSYRMLAQTAAPTDANVSFYGEIIDSTVTIGAYRDPAVKIRVIKA